MSDPAEALLELAWAERRLAAEGRVEELEELQAERDRIMAAVPARPAPHQIPLLRRALSVQGEVAELLRATRDAVGAELARVGHGRTTLRGYAPAGVEPHKSFDSAA